MNQETIDKLKQNPHYKFHADGTDPEPEEATFKTFGVLDKQDTMTIPKHPTEPKVRTNKKVKKPIDK